MTHEPRNGTNRVKGKGAWGALIATCLVVLLLPSNAAVGPLDATWDQIAEASSPDGGPGEHYNLFIGPGAQLLITKSIGLGAEQISLCTANWVWKDNSSQLYLGTAGHCITGDDPDVHSTHGAGADFDPDSVRAYVCRAVCPLGGFSGGVSGYALAKSGNANWVELNVVYARRAVGTTQLGNDFALLEIPAASYAAVHPGIPGWGGPVVASMTVPAGDFALMHANGAVTSETFLTKSRTGKIGVQTNATVVRTTMDTSGGDSGGPIAHIPAASHAAGNDSDVRAAGIQTHGSQCTEGLVCTSATGTTIPRAIQMAREAGLCIELVLVSEDPTAVTAAADCGL
jgi:hypothetical protein